MPDKICSSFVNISYYKKYDALLYYILKIRQKIAKLTIPLDHTFRGSHNIKALILFNIALAKKKEEGGGGVKKASSFFLLMVAWKKRSTSTSRFI